MTSGLAGAAVFVGRETELHDIATSLEAAASGQAQFLLALGEPGAGKTRLATEAEQRAAGFRCVWGRAWDDEGAPPLWPWIELVRNVIAAVPADQHTELFSGAAGDLVVLTPEVRRALPDLPEPVALDPQGTQFRLYQALAQLMTNLTSTRPALVVFDDLHASDEASIKALQFVARTCRALPLCVIATSREVELRERIEAQPALEGLLREFTTIAVGGLDGEALGALAQSRLGFPISAELRNSLLSATSGNAFFADELLRSLAARDDIGPETGRLPSRLLPLGVRAAIRRRLDSFDETGRRVLRLAALIGPEFDKRTLSRAAEVDELGVEQIAARAADAGLLEPGADRHRFVHDLTRETLAAEIEVEARPRAHLAIACAFESLPSGSTEHLEEIAHHRTTAGGVGDPEVALEFARRATARARRETFADRAVLWCSRAVEMLEHLPRESQDLRGDLLLELGELLLWQGEIERGRGILRDVTALAKERDDPHLRARAAVAFSGAEPETGVVEPERVRLLEDARAGLEGSGDPLEALVDSELVAALYFSDERHRIDELSATALDVGRRSQDPAIHAAAVQARLFALWGPGRLEERVALAGEGLEVAERAELHLRIIVFRTRRIMQALEQGRPVDADAEIEALTQRAHRIGDPRVAGYLSLFDAMRRCMRGDFQGAEGRVLETFAAADRWPGEKNLVQFAGIQLYVVRREQRRLGELEPIVRGVAAQFPRVPTWRAVLALLLVETERPEEAAAEIAALGGDGFAGVPRDGNWMVTIAVAAETVAALGDTKRAEVLYDLLAPQAGGVVLAGLAAVYYGGVQRYLGILASALGRSADAAGHLEAAVEFEEGMGAAPFVADAKVRLADALASSGPSQDRDRAARVLAEGEGIAREIGALRIVELASEVAARATGAPVGGGASEDRPSRRIAFRRDGDGWAVGPADSPFRIRGSRGLDQLHRMLARPGDDLTAIELVQDAGPAAIGEAAAHEAVTRQGESEDDVLDERARAEYRAQLESLRGEIEEAEANNDTGRASELRGERERIAEVVAAATGLGGRSRRHASGTERARINVTRTVRDAIKRIRENDPALGDHLEKCVRTGRLCGYSPDPLSPIDWDLR
ncbi:MAG: AAA family ATPase [Candidatus Binatia bacterium]|nr:AAA family ATPase [Candidatus Binatia bacterium]